MLKLIFLDFDGVILESAGIKTNAFGKLFSSYPEHIDAIMKYERNSGASRYEKFHHIYENILHLELTEEKKAELSKNFSELVVDELMICPFVPGVVDFLEIYSENIKFVVASAAPDEELKYLVRKRNLDRYIQEVYGLSAKKSEIMNNVLTKENLSKNESLFIGDSPTDYNYAKFISVPFIGRIRNSKNPFPEKVKTIHDFTELGSIVKNLL